MYTLNLYLIHLAIRFFTKLNFVDPNEYEEDIDNLDSNNYPSYLLP